MILKKHSERIRNYHNAINDRERASESCEKEGTNEKNCRNNRCNGMTILPDTTTLCLTIKEVG
jgi:hypothetical protein